MFTSSSDLYQLAADCDAVADGYAAAGGYADADAMSGRAETLRRKARMTWLDENPLLPCTDDADYLARAVPLLTD